MLLRGGMLPMAYVYPQAMRATRDLLRRRMSCVRSRSELRAHIHNTNSQYNLPAFGKNLAARANRGGVAEAFADPHVQKTITVDLRSLDFSDRPLTDLELHIGRTAKEHDPDTFYRLRSIPGVGKILALVLLYEIHDISRFPRVQDFVSARLVRCPHESAGKRTGVGPAKIGKSTAWGSSWTKLARPIRRNSW